MTKLRNTFLSLGLAIIASLSFVQPASADVVDIKQPLQAAGIIATPITASPDAKLPPFTKVSVETSSTPASLNEASVVTVQYSQPEAVTTKTSQVPVAKKNVTPAPPRTIAPKPVVKLAPIQAAASGRGAAILASAYGQIGITQDCTAMVERALGSIGIITGDIGPLGFLKYGVPTANPQPGDLIVSAGHVAVYAGNGMAISGGWNGSQTALHPAKYTPGVYIHI